MAKRGSVKWFSQKQENEVAHAYGGVASASSGGSVTDQGDVRTSAVLYECKHRGTYAKPARSVSVKLDDFEKIADEAWSEGKQPAMALRIYAPDSTLANPEGFVDIVARLQSDDVGKWV